MSGTKGRRSAPRRSASREPSAGADRSVTMRDIARATGLSQSTVSRVLNRTPTVVPIAEKTRERVIATAKQLGYRPNPLARGLRGASTMLLGVIVRDITDPFFAGAIEAVTVEASRRGYNVVLGHAHARADEAIALWGVLEARHCDAIVLLGDMRDQPRLIEDLAGRARPVVALWQGSRPTDVAVGERRQPRRDPRRSRSPRRTSVTDGSPSSAAASARGHQGARGGVRRATWPAIVEPLREGYIQHGPNEFAGGVTALERGSRAAGAPDGRGDVDRRPRDRRATRGARARGCGVPAGCVDHGLRRHPGGGVHRAVADDGAHAGARDGGEGGADGARRSRTGSTRVALRSCSRRSSCARRRIG